MSGPINAIGTAQTPTGQSDPKAPYISTLASDLREPEAGVGSTATAGGPAASSPGPGVEKALEAAINDRLARYLGSDVRLQIDVDKATGAYVYKSVDKSTGEVRRQFPAEDVLRTLAFFKDLDGLLLDQKA